MVTVTTYKELMYYIELFKKIKPSLMLLVSRGGLGKTNIAEKHFADAKWFRGHTTPLAFYRELTAMQAHEVQLVLDDIDLFKSAVMVGEIKQVTDTKKEQTVGYCSTHQIADSIEQEITKKFSTLVLLNKANLEKNPDIVAIADRGHCILFQPSNNEIHKYAVEKQLANQKITQFIGQYYLYAKNLSLRTYKKAEDHFAMGKEWQEKVLKEMHILPKLVEVIKLQKKYKTNNERIKHYSGSKADYYRKIKKAGL